MRVVLVVDVFPKVSTTFIAAKFVGLIDRGLDAHVVCWTSDPAMWDRIATLAARPELASRVHLVPALHKPRTLLGPAHHGGDAGVMERTRTLRASLPGGDGFGAWLAALSPDVVHFEFGARAARYLTPDGRFTWPVVVSFRGYDLNCVGLDKPGYYDGVWTHANALHFLGDDLWQRAMCRGCPPDKPHLLIPPAVDTGFFSPDPAPNPDLAADRAPVAGSPQRRLRILSVGRLHWKKGSEWALEAVRLLVESGVSVDYHIVGDGQESDAAAACITDLGLKASVSLLGSRQRHEVREQLVWTDVFLHAAVSEGFCNAVMEAQAMEVPVVCTDADGLGENVADGVTGFVVARRDPAAMADRLATLAAEPALRIRMGVAGRLRVAGRFRPQDQIDSFVRLYQAVHSGDVESLSPTATTSAALSPASD